VLWHGEAGRVIKADQLKGFEPAARWNWAAFFFAAATETQRHGDPTDWLEWRDCSERRAYFAFGCEIVRAQALRTLRVNPSFLRAGKNACATETRAAFGEQPVGIEFTYFKEE
jgi:hypothetical protein